MTVISPILHFGSWAAKRSRGSRPWRASLVDRPRATSCGSSPHPASARAPLLALAGAVLFTALAGAEQGAEVTLGSLRRAIDAKRAGRPVPGPFAGALAGYGFHWEIELGPDLRLVAVSRNLGGSLFTFGRDGAVLARRDTGEITALQLFDFDEDGLAEVILDEIDGRGTGVLLRNFHVYRSGRTSIGHLWEGVSYHRKLLPAGGDGSPAFEVRRGFLRCEPSGAGVPVARLLHVLEDARRQGPVVSRQAYAYSAGRFEPIAWPER